MAFSTDLWDQLNDNQLLLKRGARYLKGGLQLATRNMPQGQLVTIPMTNNIGFQNLAHVIVHFENAEPDLGRKGFQPEVERIAEKLSVKLNQTVNSKFILTQIRFFFNSNFDNGQDHKEHDRCPLKNRIPN